MPVDNYQTKWEEAGSVLRDFSKACSQTGGYSYEAGWMASTVQRLLIHIPQDQFDLELDILKSQTRQLEATAIVAKLTG